MLLRFVAFLTATGGEGRSCKGFRCPLLRVVGLLTSDILTAAESWKEICGL